MRDIDRVTLQLWTLCSEVSVDQLPVTHAGADDHGLWFYSKPGQPFEVQIEAPDGMCPFHIESVGNDLRFRAHSVAEAVEILKYLLHIDSLTA